MRIHAAFTLGLLALLATGCGPATVNTVPPTKPTPPPSKAAAKPAESPARWVLLPSGGVTADARLQVEGVGTIFVGRSGDRWLEKKGGGLVAAETLVPEPVRGVVRDDGGRFAYVGATGTVFFTKDALGAVVETRPAKTPLRSVSVGKRAILGIANGALMRSSDLGGSWAGVTLPKVNGTLLQVAMLGTEALALAAPQQVFGSADDGATFQQLATPGVGARRVVADANGDLILEGLIGSGVLRTSPLRLEKIMRSPTAGWDLPVIDTHGVLLGSDAVLSGAAALIGDRYVEAVQDQEVPERWRIAVTELGKHPTLKQPGELEHCDRVFVTGAETTILAACVNPVASPSSYPKNKYGPMGPGVGMLARFLKSSDGGTTWKDDGTVLASDRDKLMWLSPDGVLIVDGACKRTHSDYECSESPPVVRPPGAKAFAKAVSAQGARFEKVAFSGNRAFALGSDASGRPLLFVSQNGGRDFARKGLPPVMDEKGNAFAASAGGALGVDEGGVYVVIRGDAGKLLRYSGPPDGGQITGKIIDADFDAFDLTGRRGFAYDTSGKGYETADGGATWKKVAAPTISSSPPADRLVACSAYGCLLGDRATRVGWDLPLGSTTSMEAAPPVAKKTIGRTPFKCTADGEWKPLVNVAGGSAANADLGGATRWVQSKRDPAKGTLGAIVGSVGPKGLDTKEITLFGQSPVDSAGTVIMQVEGVAALRYSFKRDKPTTSVAITPKPPIVGKYPIPSSVSKFIPITAKQTVDIEVSWYLAATGKTYKGVIKGAGPLEPSKDVSDMREQPSIARTGLLSIAKGGIHVRPFMSAGADSPLYWVSESGKVEKLVWPEVPLKDVRGRPLTLRLDAARVGGRSVVFGDTGGGLQIFLAWANQAGNTWESRAWGLWPEVDEARDAWLRFIDSGDKPILGVIAPGSKELAGAAFAVPVDGNKADPEVLGPLPTQKSMPDPPRACGKTPPPWRITTPYTTGTRHPIQVSVDGREVIFASSNQIIRSGPGAEACVSAMDAQQVTMLGPKSTTGTTEWFSMLIHPDDLAHATLWRTAWKSGSGNETTVRTMSCTLAPGPVPETLANTAGFVD